MSANNNDLDRQDYLSQKWAAYPVAPPQAVHSGRIHQMTRNSDSSIISLIRNQHAIEVNVKDSADSFPTQHLRVGDIVAVLPNNGVVLLAPQLQELPNRSFQWRHFQNWQEFQKSVRQFFSEQGFLELKTPGLVVCPGTEPALETFATDLVVGSRKTKLYLPTSPELHLKKALSYGAEKIFEIAPVFRNGEITEKHQPEFTMIEWYRSYDDLQTIKGDVEGLVRRLIDLFKVKAFDSVLKKTVSELFQETLNFRLGPETSEAELRTLAKQINVDVSSATCIDDVFFILMTEKIEPSLPGNSLVFVSQYPPYQAALARVNEQGWGERFECYWKGLELCNAFHELNDPKIQRERFNEDLEKKKQWGKDSVPLDEEFLKCLEAGMPPSAGIALGLERLFMALFDINDIKEIKLFSY